MMWSKDWLARRMKDEDAIAAMTNGSASSSICGRGRIMTKTIASQ